MTSAETYNLRVSRFKARHGIGMSRMPRNPQFRNYDAGKINRLTADWNTDTLTADSAIRDSLIIMRARSRDFERNNEYGARYFKALENNVLADRVGFSLQMQIKRLPDFVKMDDVANAKIEQAWKEWCRKKNCTENGEDSFFDVCKLVLRSAARDGAILVRPIINSSLNDFGFALRLIEIDFLDQNYTTLLTNGNRTIMGVEKDPIGRTTAYHILTRHPGDLLIGQATGYRIRVPASEIIHYFLKERTTQTVGVPWTVAPATRLKHLKEYELAELVASRKASNKGGYFTSERGDSYAGEAEVGSDGVETGNTVSDFQPGQDDQLPPGMKFIEYDPQHPTQQYGQFTKDALLGIAAGLNMSYATLTGDLSGANYSSMRAGSIEERETWKKIQTHMIEHFCEDIFERWLEVALTGGAINLPLSKFDLFNKPCFTGRRWDWVDPEKDINAALMEIDGGLSSRTRWTEENGMDYEELCAQLAQEQAIAKANGLNFITPQTKLIQAAEAKIPVDAPAPAI